MTRNKIQARYDKIRIALRWRLHGMEFRKAQRAFELVDEMCKDETRKDKITPAFIHQIEIANYALTLKIPRKYMKNLVAVILLHDVLEDTDFSNKQMVNMFGQKIHDAVWKVTKKTPSGITKDMTTLFQEMSTDPLAALAKGCDRINNYQSMAGVFTKEKQLQYLDEGKKYFLPMLKAARKANPKLADAFLNIETMLKYQIHLLTLINKDAAESSEKSTTVHQVDITFKPN